MLNLRNFSIVTLVMGASVVALLIAGSSAGKSADALPDQSESTLAATNLTGTIRGMDGKPLQGITVSARNVEKTFTTTVFTDEQGNYIFPPVDEGKYRVWAQAVGYEAGRAELNLDPSKEIRQNFTLKTKDDFWNELSGSEMVAALPSDTQADRRMKQIFQDSCAGCHEPEFALQNRFDEAGWRAIIGTMERIGPTPGSWSKNVEATLAHFQDELAVYLAKVRGPGPSLVSPHPLARPTGDAARVVITEYDIPPAYTPGELSVEDGSDWSEGVPGSFVNNGTHDVAVDFSGNAWVSSSTLNTNRSYAKVDAITGKVTNFRVPAESGYAMRSHGIVADRNGIIWLNLYGIEQVTKTPGGNEHAKLGRIDPKTGKLDIFAPPAGMHGLGGHLDVDGNGKIWAVTSVGAIRFDPDTQTFTDFQSIPPNGETYGLAADIDGNGWWTITSHDRLGNANVRTSETRQAQLKPRLDMKEFATEDDRKFYARSDMLTYRFNVSVPWAQSPRVLGSDPSAPYIWTANFFGQSISRVNTRTFNIDYYNLPIPYANAYDVDVDNNHVVWVDLRNANRVGKFDPETMKWTVYNMPTLGIEARQIAVDRHTGNVWLPYWRTSKVGRLQFRTEHELAAVKAKLAVAGKS